MGYLILIYLILIRDGAPGLNPEDRFAGWMAISLTKKGIKEDLSCAIKLENIEFDLAFTSNLVRAQETLFIILPGQNKTGIFVHEKAVEKSNIGKVECYSYPIELSKNLIPIYYTAALNELYYGKLQGRKKIKNGRKIWDRKGHFLALGF